MLRIKFQNMELMHLSWWNYFHGFPAPPVPGHRGPNSACGYRTRLHHWNTAWSMVLLFNGNQQIMARLPSFLQFFVFQASLQPLSTAQGSLSAQAQARCRGSLKHSTALKPDNPGPEGQKKNPRQAQHFLEGCRYYRERKISGLRNNWTRMT